MNQGDLNNFAYNLQGKTLYNFEIAYDNLDTKELVLDKTLKYHLIIMGSRTSFLRTFGIAPEDYNYLKDKRIVFQVGRGQGFCQVVDPYVLRTYQYPLTDEVVPEPKEPVEGITIAEVEDLKNQIALLNSQLIDERIAHQQTATQLHTLSITTW